MDNIKENIDWICRLCINVYINKIIDKSNKIRSIDFIFDFLFVLGGIGFIPFLVLVEY